MPARPVRRVQLYVLQTHLPDFQNFPQRIQQILCIWCTYRSILRLSRPHKPTKRRVWRFYSSILAAGIWVTAPKPAIKSSKRTFCAPAPKILRFCFEDQCFRRLARDLEPVLVGCGFGELPRPALMHGSFGLSISTSQ